ncbi:MAG: serine/threonine protein kinase [Myxococcales bacterium]|nr:serine/threonine protein kinase [Myxococcales bacterium]
MTSSLGLRSQLDEGTIMKACPVCKQQYDGSAKFCAIDGSPLVEKAQAPAQAASPSAALPAIGVPAIAMSAVLSAPVAVAGEVLGGRFVVGAALRTGRTGELLRGRDDQTGAQVAIKRVAPHVVAHPQVAARVDRELGVLGAMHAIGSARVLASGRASDRLWVATEWIEDGKSLDAVIATRGPLPLPEALAITVQVGEALLEAGKLGIVHRDLAPKNVLISAGQVKLINWALPVAVHEKVAGVPTFVSPEHVEGRLVDQRSNIYSLAALFYFAVTGQPPFAGNTESVHRAHVTAALPVLSARASTPTALDPIIAKAMDKSASRRYMTLRQFLDELVAAAKAPAISESTTLGAPALVAPRLPDVGPGLAAAPVAAAPVIGSPFARSGAAELGQTLVGVIGGTDVNARTKQVDAVDPALLRSLQQPSAAIAVPNVVVESSSAPIPLVQAAIAPPAAVAPALVAPAAVPVAAPAPVLAPAIAPAIAPMAAPPIAAESASRAADVDADGKPKFRETLWFKKGELDALSAQQASGSETKIDSLPIEDRYNDDGTLSGGDAARYSLRTGGGTGAGVRTPRATDGRRLGTMSEDELVSELKGGRGKWIAIGVGVCIALVIVIVLFAL